MDVFIRVVQLHNERVGNLVREYSDVDELFLFFSHFDVIYNLYVIKKCNKCGTTFLKLNEIFLFYDFSNE